MVLCVPLDTDPCVSFLLGNPDIIVVKDRRIKVVIEVMSSIIVQLRFGCECTSTSNSRFK